MVQFKDGTLIKGAYVVIDGEEHEVHMPEAERRNTGFSRELKQNAI